MFRHTLLLLCDAIVLSHSTCDTNVASYSEATKNLRRHFRMASNVNFEERDGWLLRDQSYKTYFLCNLYTSDQ
jgi:hypothetical protein